MNRASSTFLWMNKRQVGLYARPMFDIGRASTLSDSKLAFDVVLLLLAGYLIVDQWVEGLLACC